MRAIKDPVFWVMLLCISSIWLWYRSCSAADWDATDKVLFGTFVGLQIVDGAQTSYASHHPDEFREANPVLGSHPSDAKIILFKSALVGGVYWLVKDVDPTQRKIVLGILDLLYVSVTAHNAAIGVKIGF